jgi:hypothetical protein
MGTIWELTENPKKKVPAHWRRDFLNINVVRAKGLEPSHHC